MNKVGPYSLTTHMQTHQTIPKKILPFIWQMTKGNRRLLFGAFLLALIGETVVSFLPYVYKIVVDGIQTQGTAEVVSFIVFWSIVYVSAFLFFATIFRLSSFLGVRGISRAVESTAYPALRDYLQKHSHRFFSGNFAGGLNAKEIQVGGGMRNLLHEAIWTVTATAIGLLVTTGLMFSVDVRAGVTFVTLIVVIILCNLPLFKWQGGIARMHAKAIAKIRGVSIDALTNMRAVHSFAQGSQELSRLTETLEDARVIGVKKSDVAQYILIINTIIILLAVSGILALLIISFQQGTATSGDFVLVFALISSVWRELTRIGFMINNISQIYSEAEEGLVAISQAHEVIDVENAQDLVAKKGEIVLDGISFAHEAVEVFKNFNLTIKDGERIGLVGKSGAGKSTLVSLLLREYDIAGGAIKIDDQNIAEVTQDSLRRAISVVPQEPALFHRSIRENIAYARPDATDEEVRDAAQKAHALEFIDMLPEGMNTLVGERGVKLSGGQRQRVAIARAILKDAPILILDEATSALDSESEVAVQKALKELMYGKTVIAIAHRLSTLRDMSRILVLEHGTIQEDGTHEELLKNSGTYATLWNHQAGGFLQEE